MSQNNKHTYLPSFEVASSDSLTCTKWSTPNKDHIILYQSLGSLYRFYPIRYFFSSYFVSFSVHVLFYNFHCCCVFVPVFILIFVFYLFYSISFLYLLAVDDLFVPCYIQILFCSIRILFGTNSACWMNLGFGSNCLIAYWINFLIAYWIWTSRID